MFLLLSNSFLNLFTTLDAFFQDKDKEQLFIKMDIEGAERYALQGSKNLFQNCNLQFALSLIHS